MTWQTPEMQASPEGQLWPQVPQLVPSDCVLTSQPSSGLVLQSAKPLEQAVMAQESVTHDDVAFGRLQARPHAPQLRLSVVRLVSQPSAAVWSQSAKPGLQPATAQAPPAQVLIVAWGSAHAVPHAPQLAGSFAVLAHDEVPDAMQMMSGAAQVVPQTPPEHTCPAPQGRPQAPQLALSVWVFTSQPSGAM